MTQTHLGTFLSTIIAEQGIDAKTLAARMAVNPSVLCRLIKGRRKTCTEATLRKIVAGSSASQSTQVQCLIAYLKDQAYHPLASMISITTK
jgi:plasmid maintenance system antidote protein VapI